MKSNPEGVLLEGELAEDPGRLKSERLRCAIFGVAGLIIPETLPLIVRVRIGRLAFSGLSVLGRDFALCDFFRCSSGPVCIASGTDGLWIDDDGVGTGVGVLRFKDSAIISISLPISDVKGDEPREFIAGASSSSLRLGDVIEGCGYVKR